MIRYGKLGYVELNVTDLERSRRFYDEHVGMQPLGMRGNAAVFRCDAEPWSVALHPSREPGLKRVGHSLESDAQFEPLHARLHDAGVGWRWLSDDECADRQVQRATQMVEPHSRVTLEFYVRAPIEPPPVFTPRHTLIQRLGHIVFVTPEKDRSVAFFRDVLNFRESDSIGEWITFMRPFPNPFHHGLAVGKAPRYGMHHLNLMVSEFDDIGKGLNRCNHNGVPIVFGPGRHLASGSAFLYYLDPDGLTLEYSFGMERFDEHAPRAPTVFPPVPESIDSWGAKQDPRFAARGTTEGAPA